jgi:hypothetical protein
MAVKVWTAAYPTPGLAIRRTNADVVCFKLASQHSTTGTEENQEVPQQIQLVSALCPVESPNGTKRISWLTHELSGFEPQAVCQFSLSTECWLLAAWQSGGSAVTAALPCMREPACTMPVLSRFFLSWQNQLSQLVIVTCHCEPVGRVDQVLHLCKLHRSSWRGSGWTGSVVRRRDTSAEGRGRMQPW